MKLIIAGSRAITSYPVLERSIKYHKLSPIEIISGRAKGPDTLGELYAANHNIPLMAFPADWAKYSRRAGFIRNEEMGDYADALLALWDGYSPGTHHMIQYMKKLKKPVYLTITDPKDYDQCLFWQST